MARTRSASAANHGPPPHRGDRRLGKGRAWSPGRRLAVAASISALLLILCAHRILPFTPQPLDSPGSLRPFLYALFGRFLKRYSNPEQAQQAWGTYRSEERRVGKE